MLLSRLSVVALALLATSSAFAFNAVSNPNIVRWTATEDADGSVAHVLEVLSQKLGRPLSANDFILQEDRDLAFNHYKRLVQKIDGIPVRGKSIRIWTERGSDRLVQVEALLEAPAQPSFLGQLSMTRSLRARNIRALREGLSAERTAQLARRSVASDLDDPNVRGMSWEDEWHDGVLVRTVKVKGKRGEHFVKIGIESGRVISREYREFPQIDNAGIPVQIYQIYEETEMGERLSRVPGALKNLLPTVPVTDGDIYAPLKSQRYFESKLNPILGELEEGRALGFWAPRYVKEQAALIRAGLPQRANDFASGLLLQGLYTSINIHPDAFKMWGPLSFEARFSSPFLPNWVESVNNGEPEYEMIPSTAFSGKPLYSAAEAWNRPARRLPNQDPREYLNDGFDEIQVYYGVDQLFEELHARGFTDPELSTRPFHAFLFNPDISMRDNAYYTDDTINFTTYSPNQLNFARDNSTIWHELGHGIMDRLMGDHIELADTGGLSEGMADFLAQIVVQAVTEGKPFPGSAQFRIINHTGFFLTNEVHDDGEAYGGAMNDFMQAAIRANGSHGLHQVTDVVLEAMRLTRDYPGLTAADWFGHILFADSLGRPGLRQPGELTPLLLGALASRNFKMDGGEVAQFSLVNTANQEEVVSGRPGSRQAPILVPLPKEGNAAFTLKAAVKNSDSFSFRFPVRVRVQLKGGPIQGAIHWSGEEGDAKVYTLNSEADVASIPLNVSGTCDEANRDDGSCVDYAYVQLWNDGETDRPVAKKRFYLRVKN